MKLILLDLLFTEELINDVLCDIEALWLESEFAMHVNYPFQQKSPRRVSNLRLNFGNVIVVNHELQLFPLHVFEVLLRILSN